MSNIDSRIASRATGHTSAGPTPRPEARSAPPGAVPAWRAPDGARAGTGIGTTRLGSSDAAGASVDEAKSKAIGLLRRLAATPAGMDRLMVALSGKARTEIGEDEARKLRAAIQSFVFRDIEALRVDAADRVDVLSGASGPNALPLGSDAAFVDSGAAPKILLARGLDLDTAVSGLLHEYGHGLARAARANGAQVAPGEIGERLELVLTGQDPGRARNPTLYGESNDHRIRVRSDGVEVDALGAKSSVGPLPLNRDGYYVEPDHSGNANYPPLSVNGFLDTYAAQNRIEGKKTVQVSGTNVSGRDRAGAASVAAGPWKAGVWIYPKGHVMVQTLDSGVQVVRDAKRGRTMVVDMKTGSTMTYTLKTEFVSGPMGSFGEARGTKFDTVAMDRGMDDGRYRLIAGFASDGKPIWRTVDMDGSPVRNDRTGFNTALSVFGVQRRGAAAFDNDTQEMLSLRAANAESASGGFFKGGDIKESVVSQNAASKLLKETALMGALMDQGALNVAHNAVKAAGKKGQHNIKQFNTLLQAESSRNGELVDWIDTKARPEWDDNTGAQRDRLIQAIGGQPVADALLKQADELIGSYQWKPEGVANADQRVRNALYVYKMLGTPEKFAERQKQVDDGNLIKVAPDLLDKVYEITGFDAGSNEKWRKGPRALKQIRTAVVDSLTNNTKGKYASDVVNGTTINGTSVAALAPKLDKNDKNDKQSATRWADALLKGGRVVTDFMRTAVSLARTAGFGAALVTYLEQNHPGGRGLSPEMTKVYNAAGRLKGMAGKPLWWTIVTSWLAAEGATIVGRVAKGVASDAGQIAALGIRALGYGVGLWGWQKKLAGVNNNQDGVPRAAATTVAGIGSAAFAFLDGRASDPRAIPIGMGTGDLGAMTSAIGQAKLDYYSVKLDPQKAGARPRGRSEGNLGTTSAASLGVQALSAYIGAYLVKEKKYAAAAAWAAANAVSSWVDLGARTWRDALYIQRA